MKKVIFFSLAILFGALTRAAYASPCSPSMTFTTGQTLTAAVLNSNPTTFSGCFNNLDNTNIGSAGLYASQLLPTNTGQATFGGMQTYTFPASAVITGGLSTNGFIDNVAGTFTGTLFANGGTQTAGLIDTTGATFQGAIQQKVGSTTYTAPYDAQSTAGSTSTHLEHGTIATGTYGGGFACAASQNFAKAFASTPTVVGTLAAGGSSGVVYPNSVSTTAFTICAFKSGANVGSETINWIAIGE